MNQEVDKKEDEILEDTNEIKIGNADIGKFNLVLFAIMVIICVVYLFTHFSE